MADRRFVRIRKVITDPNIMWDYTIKRWSEQQTEVYYRLLLHTCQEATNAPFSGMNYESAKS